MGPMLAALMEAAVPSPRPCEGTNFSGVPPRNLLLIADDLVEFLEDPDNHPARCGLHRYPESRCTCGVMPLVHAYRHRRPAEPVGPAAGPRNLVYEIGLAIDGESVRTA